MLYTVSSRGRTIGVTDLGFMRLGGVNRSGYFHPNEEGERLVPSIAAGVPAMRAYMCRDTIDAHGRSIVQPQMIGSTVFADIAEALHRTAEFELAVHREDGSLVPTEQIGIQDTEQFRHLVGVEIVEVFNDGEEPDEADLELLLAQCDDDSTVFDADDADERLRACREDGAEGSDDEDQEDEDTEPWLPEDLVPPYPRYQIHVRLLDAAEVP